MLEGTCGGHLVQPKIKAGPTGRKCSGLSSVMVEISPRMGMSQPFGLPIAGLTTCTRAAPKVGTPILLCWPITSEAEVGGMSTDVEPFCQYSIIQNVHYR